MTYHEVFNISERVVDALFVVPALAGLVFVLVLMLRRRWRAALIRLSPALLAMAAILWAAFEYHDTGGVAGLGFGAGLAVVLFVGAGYLCVEEPGLELETGIGIFRAGAVGVFAASIVLVVVLFLALGQISVFTLERRLADGQVGVVSGRVDQHLNSNWASECFTVDGQRFCYNDGPTSVGFHQSHNNGGPIHDGLQVRVTYVGDDIVRLEIADGQ